MNNIQTIQPLAPHMTADELTAYAHTVDKILVTMNPGQYMRIHKWVKDENVAVFKAIVKSYIDETKDYTIEFTSDYTQIRKISW